LAKADHDSSFDYVAQPAVLFIRPAYCRHSYLIPADVVRLQSSARWSLPSVGPLNRRQTEIRNGSDSCGTPIPAFRLPSGWPSLGSHPLRLSGGGTSATMIARQALFPPSFTGPQPAVADTESMFSGKAIASWALYLGRPLIPAPSRACPSGFHSSCFGAVVLGLSA
jgi:hypothetical protein